MRILVVEDHVELADAITTDLTAAGYAVDWRTDGRDALIQATMEPYDLIVLDLGLPGVPGMTILREWRQRGVNTPVLVLTARSSWAERIDGLKAGADDYVTKPFHPEELVLRIQALLRRSHGVTNQATLKAGGLELDEATQSVVLGTQSISLTGGEFRLLRYFMLHPGHVLDKLQLAEHLYDETTERDSNVLEVYVNKLRGKLGKRIIETRRGQGYRFVGLAP